MDFRLGDVVKMKKGHPCGANEWTLLRTGVDIKLECRGCKRIIWLKRPDFNKNIRKIMNEDGKFVSIQHFSRKE